MSDTSNSNPPAESHEIQMIRKQYESNPENIPAQFEGDVNKAVESYKELQARFTKTSQELAALKKAASPEPKPDVKKEEPLPLKLEELKPEEKPPVTWESIEDEFKATGDVSEESVQAIVNLLKLPSRNFVDAHIAYLKSQRASAQAKAQEIAGGTEQYNAVIKWGHTNLSKPEKDALNQALASPGWELAWTGLVTKFKAANTDSGNRMGTNPVGTGDDTAEVFSEQREMTAAISDPRYRTDPKYRDAVQRRIIATNELRNRS